LPYCHAVVVTEGILHRDSLLLLRKGEVCWDWLLVDLLSRFVASGDAHNTMSCSNPLDRGGFGCVNQNGRSSSHQSNEGIMDAVGGLRLNEIDSNHVTNRVALLDARGVEARAQVSPISSILLACGRSWEA